MKLQVLLCLSFLLAFILPGSAQIELKPVSELKGDTLSVSLEVKGFTNISAFQFSISYDTFGLEYLRSEFADLPSFNDANLNVSGQQISTLWFENETMGHSISDGANLLVLKFRIIFPFYDPVRISSCPLQTEFFDISLSKLTLLNTVVDNSKCPALTGTVFLDAVRDCIFDNVTEKPAEGVCLKVSSASGISYAWTDKHGKFSVQGESGTYMVEIIPPDAYWNPCDTLVSIQVSDAARNVTLGLQAAYPCPMMEVHIPDSYLSNCNQKTVQIHYRNIGTLPNAATIEIELDSAYEIKGSSLPYVLQNGKLLFEIPGILEPLQKGFFEIVVQADCDLMHAGKQFYVKATASPAANCRPPGMGWDFSNLFLSGSCVDGKAAFKVENGGSDMTAASSLFIFRNNEVIERRPVILASLESEIIEIESDGAGLSALLAQPAGFAYGGYLYQVIDNCAGNSSGFSPIFKTGDPLPYNSAAHDMFRPFAEGLKIITSSTPDGYTQDHLIYRDMRIAATQELRLMELAGKKIRIRATLDPSIDPESLQFYDVNMPYSLSLRGSDLEMHLYPGAVQDTVRLAYSYYPDLSVASGTIIENTVDFYMSDSTVLRSVPFRHQIDTAFLETILSTESASSDLPGMQVFPNPASDRLWIVWEMELARAYIVNMQGIVISHKVLSSGMNEWSLEQVPPGVYFIHVRDVLHGKGIAAQKIVVR